LHVKATATSGYVVLIICCN